jgi:hypothetical protein
VADVALSIGEFSGTPRRSLVETSGSSLPFIQRIRGSGFFRFGNWSGQHSEVKGTLGHKSRNTGSARLCQLVIDRVGHAQRCAVEIDGMKIEFHRGVGRIV